MKTILLIEDNKEILENFKEYLEIEGYNILTAKNGKTGIELAKQFAPDLVVCDVLMPGMDGREVLRRFINTPKICKTPFIFSSSLSEKFNKVVALKLGADDFLLKPFTLERLLTAAKTCIKRSGKNKHVIYVTSFIVV